MRLHPYGGKSLTALIDIRQGADSQMEYPDKLIVFSDLIPPFENTVIIRFIRLERIWRKF
jgi:hypothetical protein